MDSDKLVEQVSRSARLYQRGLITAQEFTNVTLEDLHRLSNPVEPVDYELA